MPLCDVVMAGTLCVGMLAEYCWPADEVWPDDKIPSGAGYGVLEASIAISLQVAEEDDPAFPNDRSFRQARS